MSYEENIVSIYGLWFRVEQQTSHNSILLSQSPLPHTWGSGLKVYLDSLAVWRRLDGGAREAEYVPLLWG